MKNTLLTIIAIAVFAFAALAQDSSKTVRKAGELMSKGDVKGAFAVLDEAIEKKKDLLDAYKMRSAIRQMFGDDAGALSDLSAALELKPDDGQLYEQRAMARFRLQNGSPQTPRQDYGLIMKDLDAAISFGRKVESVYSLRAMIYQMSGNLDGAIVDYQTVIGLRPDWARAYVGLASLYQIADKPDKAAAVLENFVNYYEGSTAKKPQVNVTGIGTNSVIKPTDSPDRLTVMQGGVFIIDDPKNQKSPGTPEDLRKREEDLGQATNTALAYSKLAGIYLERKEYERATVTVEKALKVFRNDYSAYQTRGEIKLATGEYRGAIADFDETLKIMPGFFGIYLERGIAYLFLNDEAKAQKDFDKYLQILPDAKTTLDKRIAETKQKIRENAVQPK